MTDEETAEMLMVITQLLVRLDVMLADLNKDFLTWDEGERLLRWSKKLRQEVER